MYHNNSNLFSLRGILALTVRTQEKVSSAGDGKSHFVLKYSYKVASVREQAFLVQNRKLSSGFFLQKMGKKPPFLAKKSVSLAEHSVFQKFQKRG